MAEKKLEIVITVDENDVLNTKFESSGFNSHELIWVLESTKQDILKFIRSKKKKK